MKKWPNHTLSNKTGGTSMLQQPTITYKEFCKIRKEFRNGELPSDGVDTFLANIVGQVLLSRSPQTINRAINKFLSRSCELIGNEVSCSHDPNQFRVSMITHRILRGTIWHFVEVLLKPEKSDKTTDKALSDVKIPSQGVKYAKH